MNADRCMSPDLKATFAVGTSIRTIEGRTSGTESSKPSSNLWGLIDSRI